MDLSFGPLTLAASLLICSYLLSKAFTPPNPPPPKDRKWRNDSLMRHQTPTRRWIGLSILALGWCYHPLIILFQPATPSLFCPHPENLDPRFFTWSPYTISYILLIFVAAPIRLLAFAQLGQDFNFELTKPKALVKTGLYKYVRHPSYPALFACQAGAGALYLRVRGVMGCWLSNETATMLERWDVWVLVLLGVATFFLLRVRIKEEEEMLRSAFGEEYEEYARRTRRFLPGIV